MLWYRRCFSNPSSKTPSNMASSAGPGGFYAHTTVITYTEGEVWLSSTPDGQGELFTDDVAAITVTHEGGDYAVYTHDYYDPLGSVYTTTAPVEFPSRPFSSLSRITLTWSVSSPR